MSKCILGSGEKLTLFGVLKPENDFLYAFLPQLCLTLIQ
jgi:hypothetical protein